MNGWGDTGNINEHVWTRLASCRNLPTNAGKVPVKRMNTSPALWFAAMIVTGCTAKDSGASEGTSPTSSTSGVTTEEATSLPTSTSTNDTVGTTATTTDASSGAQDASTTGGGSSSDDGGACPEGETCKMNSVGDMVCLGEVDHCVLACDDTMTCPDGMVCQQSVCHYHEGMRPPMGDPAYPPMEDGACPEGTFGPTSLVGVTYYFCAPECDGTGMEATCPDGATGTATGWCAFNPTSSGSPC